MKLPHRTVTLGALALAAVGAVAWRLLVDSPGRRVVARFIEAAREGDIALARAYCRDGVVVVLDDSSSAERFVGVMSCCGCCDIGLRAFAFARISKADRRGSGREVVTVDWPDPRAAPVDVLVEDGRIVGLFPDG